MIVLAVLAAAAVAAIAADELRRYRAPGAAALRRERSAAARMTEQEWADAYPSARPVPPTTLDVPHGPDCCEVHAPADAPLRP